MSTRAAPAYQTLSIERGEGIDRLTLGRPARHNAIDPAMAAELADYFSGLAGNEQVRVVVMQGAGRHFCVGFDLDHLDAITGSIPEALRVQRQMAAVVLAMRRCPQPIIGLIQGAAVGAGFALALAADVRYVSEDARMNVAMAKVGLTGCDMGISYFLPRAVGTSNAAELMMGGRFVDAARALRIGLVSEVVPREQLATAGDTLAREMLCMSGPGLRLTKEGLNLAQDLPSLDAVIALEDRGQVLCIGSFMREGVAAFKERRAPDHGPDGNGKPAASHAAGLASGRDGH